MHFRFSSAALAGVAIAALCTPSYGAEQKERALQTAWEASRTHEDDGKIVTGVARARDRLDSATSTSSITDNEIVKVSPTSLGDLFRNIPGIRAEASSGETNGNYTIRGLPLIATGAKYLQFQEDGLPVLEFGDISGIAADTFLRADLNIAQVESIRGGSSSTFASNAPGGVINLISHTGEVEGGSVQASAGLNYESYRSDFEYGGHLSDSLRFHIGGFYRQGDGPRHVGYTADRGGQVKFNVTKEFSGGFIRFEGKLLDDHTAQYAATPVAVTGTNGDPSYKNVPNFSVNSDSLLSRYITSLPTLDGNGALTQANLHDGFHAVAKSIGFQTKFDISGWTVSEHMRYSDQSGSNAYVTPLAAFPAAAAAAALGAPGGKLVYASGPQKGDVITSPSTLNGNGLAVYSAGLKINLRSLNNFTNDLRISRVWNMGGGDLTGTAGVYTSRQDLNFDVALANMLQDVKGNGGSALINIVNANGTPRTQGGFLDFSGPRAGINNIYDVQYDVLAPYGSLNFHRGKVSLGVSARLDTGNVDGTIRTNTAADIKTIDINNDGIISDAEKKFAFVPLGNSTPVNYRYHYVSYSGSVNYRISQVFSTFARYSKGARAGADRILFSAVNSVDGSLLVKSAAYDPVKQAEIGLKYRNNGLFVNLTGFGAKVSETNIQVLPVVVNGVSTTRQQLVHRSYRAYGGELEGGVRHGPLSLTVGATMTNAEITAANDPTLVGHTPRHQAKLIFQMMPQYDTDLFTVGANVIGTTSSYTQDQNQLKMPGYATVSAFLQVRPIDRVVLSLNVNNLFDTKAFTDVSAASMPASGVTFAQTLLGRTISTSVRFYL